MSRKSIFGMFISVLVFLFLLPTRGVQADTVVLSVSKRPSITIDFTGGDIELDLLSANGNLQTADTSVRVKTNATYGYSLYAMADQTSLVRTATVQDGSRPEIRTLDSSYDAELFPGGRWGISFDGSEFDPFQTDMLIGSNDIPSDDSIDLTFGVKSDSSIRVGTYELIINFVGLANIPELVLQEQDAETLAEILLNDSDVEYFRDSRDGNYYPVGRLADGSYWMLENLRLGDYKSMELTPEDTNIGYSYTLPGLGDYSYDYSVGSMRLSNRNEYVSYGPRSEKQGAFYNYCAASAGQLCRNDNPYWYNSETTTRYHLENDICPKGWHIPDSAEINSLMSAYSYSELDIIAAFRMVPSGYFQQYSSQYNTGQYGFVWLSEYYDNLGVKSIRSENNYSFYNNSGMLSNNYGAGEFMPPHYFINIRCTLGASSNISAPSQDEVSTGI